MPAVPCFGFRSVNAACVWYWFRSRVIASGAAVCILSPAQSGCFAFGGLVAVFDEFFDVRLTPFTRIAFEGGICRVANERSYIQAGLSCDKTLKLGNPKEIAKCDRALAHL